MRKKIVIYVALSAVIFGVVLSTKPIYQYSDLKDYLAVLLTVSSMVFTLMGIWIAFLYPNALQRILDSNEIGGTNFDETLGETKRLEGLVGSVLRSAFIVGTIMCLQLSKLVLTSLTLSLGAILVIKSSVLALVVVLTLLQIESICYVIYSNIMFINELHNERQTREADRDI